jgi:hypothetical protein
VSDDKSKIHFPKKHLISGLDNEDAYFFRVADEILRNRRLQGFLLNSRQYLNQNYREYMVNTDEMILLQSLLTHEYFEGLVPFKENQYIHAINYMMSEPLITQPYSNVVPLEDQYQMNHLDMTTEQEEFERRCIKNPNKDDQAVVGNLAKRDNLWNRSSFPPQLKELIMRTDVLSTFYPILYIVFKHTGQWHTIEEIRKKLIDAYRSYMDLYREKILDLWKFQGKYRMVKRIENGISKWEDVIQSDEYGFSNLDLWVMCDVYRLPVVLFSSTKNKLSNLGVPLNTDWILLYSSKDIFKTNTFFVRGAGTKDPRAIASFHLIKPSIPILEKADLAKRIRELMREPERAEYANHLSSLEEHFGRYEIKEMVRL